MTWIARGCTPSSQLDSPSGQMQAKIAVARGDGHQIVARA
jgi:hypothetical protein